VKQLAWHHCCATIITCPPEHPLCHHNPTGGVSASLLSPPPPPPPFITRRGRPPHQPMEIYVDDDTKLTLHGLQQYYIKLGESEKNRKLNDLLDALEFNQVRVPAAALTLDGQVLLGARRSGLSNPRGLDSTNGIHANAEKRCHSPLIKRTLQRATLLPCSQWPIEGTFA